MQRRPSLANAETSLLGKTQTCPRPVWVGLPWKSQCRSGKLVLGNFSLAVSSPKPLDPTSSVNQLLFAGEKGVAGGANLQVDIAFMTRAGLEGAAAGTTDVYKFVGGMDIAFHCITLNGAPSTV